MLLDHGWLPDEVDKWHDPAGACWHVDYACPFAVGRLWEALAESIAREQWRRVGESPQFTGIAKGADFTAPKRMLKQALVAEQQNRLQRQSYSARAPLQASQAS